MKGTVYLLLTSLTALLLTQILLPTPSAHATSTLIAGSPQISHDDTSDDPVCTDSNSDGECDDNASDD
jgi:hypothetical protein